MNATYEMKEYLQFKNERIYPGDEVLIYFDKDTFVSGYVGKVSVSEIVLPHLMPVRLRDVRQILKKVDGKWMFLKEENNG